MKRNVWMALSVIVLLAITFVNVAIYASSQTTSTVTGKGDSFTQIEGNITTVGCNRLNENSCKVVTIVYVK